MAVMGMMSKLPLFSPESATAVVRSLDILSRKNMSRLSSSWHECVRRVEQEIYNPFKFLSIFFPASALNEFWSMQTALQFLLVGDAVLHFFKGLSPSNSLEIIITKDRSLALIYFLKRMDYIPVSTPNDIVTGDKHTSIYSFLRTHDGVSTTVHLECCQTPLIVHLLGKGNLHKNFMTSNCAYSLYPLCSVIENFTFPISCNKSCRLPRVDTDYPPPRLTLNDCGELNVLKRRIGDECTWRIFLPIVPVASVVEDFFPGNIEQNVDFELHSWRHTWWEHGLEICFRVLESDFSFCHTVVPEMSKGDMFLPSVPESELLSNARLWNRYLPGGPFMSRRLLLARNLLMHLPPTVDGRTIAFMHAFLLFFMRSDADIKMYKCSHEDGGVTLVFKVLEFDKNKYLKDMERAAFGIRSLLAEYDILLTFKYSL